MSLAESISTLPEETKDEMTFSKTTGFTEITVSWQYLSCQFLTFCYESPWWCAAKIDKSEDNSLYFLFLSSYLHNSNFIDSDFQFEIPQPSTVKGEENTKQKVTGLSTVKSRLIHISVICPISKETRVYSLLHYTVMGRRRSTKNILSYQLVMKTTRHAQKTN